MNSESVQCFYYGTKLNKQAEINPPVPCPILDWTKKERKMKCQFNVVEHSQYILGQ